MWCSTSALSRKYMLVRDAASMTQRQRRNPSKCNLENCTLSLDACSRPHGFHRFALATQPHKTFLDVFRVKGTPKGKALYVVCRDPHTSSNAKRRNVFGVFSFPTNLVNFLSYFFLKANITLVLSTASVALVDVRAANDSAQQAASNSFMKMSGSATGALAQK